MPDIRVDTGEPVSRLSRGRNLAPPLSVAQASPNARYGIGLAAVWLAGKR